MAAKAAGRTPRESLPGAAEHVVLMLPVVATVALIENVQSVTAAMSMYCPSQKSPPWGSPHLVVHAPVSVLTHELWHAAFAWTVHEPVQPSWHSVVQSVEPGCSWQPVVHSESQVDEQYDEQSSPLQPAMHPCSHSLVHSVLQVKLAGMLVQEAMQLLSQELVQLVDADSVHIVEHVVV
jgi:hypothetical protein